MRKLIFHRFPSARPWYRFVAVFLLIALCFWLNLTLLSYSLCEIRGDSMQNTLHGGQIIVVQSRGFALAHGDIVVFDAGENDHIKRIIGMGGDTIRATCRQGEISLAYLVDGEERVIDEPYLKDGRFAQKSVSADKALTEADKALVEGLSGLYEGRSYTFTVPDGCLFVLGDNRAVSLDSRNHGFVSEESVLSKVVEMREEEAELTLFGRTVRHNRFITRFKVLRFIGLLVGYLGLAAIFIAGSPVLFTEAYEIYGKN